MRYFGIDIGGTRIKYSLLDGNLELLKEGNVPSNARDGGAAILKNVIEILDKESVDMIGVSTAGIVGAEGEIVYANSLIPDYTGTPLGKILSDRYGVPVGVLNDIDAAAVCEYAKTGCDDFYFLALGTGVGGVYVRGGEVIKGGSHFAGQIGYLGLHSGGTVDERVSVRGLERMCGVGAKEIFLRARGGDGEALSCIRRWLSGLSELICSIVGFISPKRIVIGGGISAEGDFLIDMIREVCEGFPVPYKDSFEIAAANSKNSSAAIGAVIYTKAKADKGEKK